MLCLGDMGVGGMGVGRDWYFNRGGSDVGRGKEQRAGGCAV
jgi:hypothetical protein